MIHPFICPVCDAEEILEVEYLPVPVQYRNYLRVDGSRQYLQSIDPPLVGNIKIPQVITKFFCGRCGYDIQDEYTDPDDFLDNREDLIDYLEQLIER